MVQICCAVLTLIADVDEEEEEERKTQKAKGKHGFPSVLASWEWVFLLICNNVPMTSLCVL